MKTRPVTINVTPVDIRDGRKRQCADCPISKAVSRKLKPRFTCIAGSQFVRAVASSSVFRDTPKPSIKHKARTYARIAMPNSAQTFILGFDNGLAMTPFRFTLNLPVSILK